MENPPNKKFEAVLRDLEGVVEKLETGDLSLEEALGAFEEGIRLVRYLGDNLTAVEKRVEVLIRDQGGAFQLQAIAEDEEEE
ncbi:MAG: exodeoxyribonuclease VII small subunit [Deltaproteobacteria bacterium]|jgi:exodeoxyribonuclease VII small subunit|nr:MAG: exodeoxyribonuclease VII small subunit [Deltaproteobacteria bacterium]